VDAADELVRLAIDDELGGKPSPWAATELVDADVAMLAVELAITTTAELAVLVVVGIVTGLVRGEEASPLPAPPPQAVNQALDTNKKLNLKNLNDRADWQGCILFSLLAHVYLLAHFYLKVPWHYFLFVST
jgi:hypothetical protein